MFRSFRNLVGGIVKSFIAFPEWARAYGMGIFGGSTAGDVRDSVWAIGGAELHGQAVSMLDIKFVNDQTELEIENPNVIQQQWIHLLYNPSPLLTTRQLFELTTMLYEIEGMAYWILLDEYGNGITNPLQIPTQILCLGKSNVTPRYMAQTDIVLGWEIRMGSVIKTVGAKSVIRFWKTNPSSFREGLSLGDKIGSSLALDKGARKVNRGFFDNGARPGGVVTAEQRVNEQELTIFKKTFSEQYGSKENSGKIAVIPHPFKFQATTDSKDMDFKDLHQLTRDEIFGGTRTPKHYMGVNDSINYATAEVLDRNFWLLTIPAKTTAFEDVINTRLLIGTGMELRFSYDKVPIIAKDQIEVQKQKLRLAAYYFGLGYPTNWINEALGLKMPIIEDDWADTPHDPTLTAMPTFSDTDSGSSSGAPESKAHGKRKHVKVISKNTDSENTVFSDAFSKAFDSAFSGLAKQEPSEETEQEILEKARSGDSEYMEKYCQIVERATSVPLIPGMQRAMESYFRRLEKSQITKIEAFISGGKTEKADGENEIREEDISGLLFNKTKWNGVIIEDTRGYHLKAYKSGVSRAKKELGGFSVFKESDQQAAESAAKLTNKITGVNDRLRASIQAAMIQSIKAGAGNAEVIESVRHEFDVSLQRANTIARTEMGIAANSGRWDAMSAEVETKEWISANDGNVREEHQRFAEMGSKSVDFQYAPGLKFPQDSECNDAGQVVNCRCVIVKGK